MKARICSIFMVLALLAPSMGFLSQLAIGHACSCSMNAEDCCCCSNPQNEATDCKTPTCQETGQEGELLFPTATAAKWAIAQPLYRKMPPSDHFIAQTLDLKKPIEMETSPPERPPRS